MPPEDMAEQEAQQDDFGELRRELTTARSLLTRAITRTREAIDAADKEAIPKVRTAIAAVTLQSSRMSRATKAVLASKTLTAESRETEIAKELEYEIKVFDIQCDADSFLRKFDPEAFADEMGRRESNSIQRNTAAGPAANSTMNSKSAAPKTTWKEILQRIPKFDGDPTKFRRWQTAFELHVDSTALDPLEKYELMLKTLTGRALKCLDSREVDAENYEMARDIIYDRFCDIALAEEQHANNLLKTCARKDLQGNRKFIDFVEDLTQSIDSLILLGGSYEGMSALASTIVLQALPYDLRRDFDKEFSASDEESRSCKLEFLMNFLNEEKKRVERIQFSIKNASSTKEEGVKQKQKYPFNRSPGAGQFRKFGNREFSPAGPTGSMSSQHAFAIAASLPADHSCIFCLGEHASQKCKKAMSPEERRKIAETRNACYKCLNRNHRADKCRAKSCVRCRGRHHELLCMKPADDTATSAAVMVQRADVASVNAVRIANVSERTLPTGFVEIMGQNIKTVGRIVLDTGSQKTLVVGRFADWIKARPVGIDSFLLQAAGQANPKRCNGKIVELTLKSRFSESDIVIHATALPNVVEGNLPVANYRGKLSPIADRNDEGWGTDICILVGVDSLYPIVGQSIKKVEGFLAIETIFGYFLCGIGQHNEIQMNPALMEVIQRKRERWPNKEARKDNSTTSLAVAIKSKYDPDDIAFLWDTEVMGIEPYFRESDEAPDNEMREFFVRTTKRAENGRYIISLPFKSNAHTLNDNRALTVRRLKSFLIQAEKNTPMLEAVDREVEDLVQQGFVELTDPPRAGEPCHYLPLLAVVKKAATKESKMKVRLVNDASARSRDAAGLNDVLHQGENLIADIVNMVIQFRQLPIAMTADIERAYLQFEITPEHRKFLRFLWPLGISSNPRAKFKEFQSCRLSFGLVAAPFLHCAGIRLHLDNEIARKPERKQLLEFVKNNFYVDDIMAGADSVEDGRKVVEDLSDSFSAGCFPLKKWATNSTEIGEFIRRKYPEASVTCDDRNFRFLGIRWNQQEDVLHVDVSKTIGFFETNTPSKRSLLKGTSQIFDPIGIAAPIVLGFKHVLQKYWRKKLDWDTSLTSDDLKEYREITMRLENIRDLQIRRIMWEPRGPSRKKRELHMFCDASLVGYGCVAYSRDVSDLKNISVSLIMAKGRVAPLKGEWSIHRLELMGAVVSTRIAKRIMQAVNEPFSAVYYWCDNACVLAWIRDKPERWKSFVENRVREIQSNSDPNQWRYIRTAQNPSDLLSRFSALDTKELREFWLYGPQWLRTTSNPENHVLNMAPNEIETEHERRSQCFIGSACAREEFDSTGIVLTSSWGRTVRVFAYVLRWRKFKRNSKPQWLTAITTKEFGEAETEIFRRIQRKHFTVELNSNLKEISKRSELYQFSPFWDKEGLIRCRSRLNNLKNVEFETKNPIILPGENDFVALYIRWTHETICRHAGNIPAILQKLRRRFLILRGRRAAKKAIKQCKGCAKFEAKPASEETPDLPEFRVETAAAFSVTGVDAAGPITVRDQLGKKVPAYIMMFVCPVARAIRLELVENLTTYEFLLAMRRFYNRNPTVKKFYSDNAASFRKAAKEMKLLFQCAIDPETQSFLTKNTIEWEFITERAPWRNAFVERMFGTVKRPLRKIMGRNILPFRELEAVLTDIEKIVNDRPLTCVSTDPNEILPLRPSDLLYGNLVQPSLPGIDEIMEKSRKTTAIILSERWKNQQNIINAFWKRYRREYLMQLRSNLTRMPVERRPLAVGDVVLIDDPAPSRSFWPMARVHTLCGGEGDSGGKRNRTCIIKLPNGKFLRRPIQLLYKMNLEADQK